MSNSKQLSFLLNLLKETRASYTYSTAIFDYAPILQKLDLKNLYKNDRSMDIIDVYPTVGAFSMALNEHLKPRKHLALEIHPLFQKSMQKMVEYSGDKSWILSDKDPFFWETMTEIVGDEGEEGKLISPKTYSKDQLHPELLITSNMAYDRGEFLLYQWLQCILNGNWLFKYGNVRMLAWCHHSTAAKLLPGPGEKNRFKYGLLAELASDMEVVATTEPKKYLFSDAYLQNHDPLIIKALASNNTARADEICLLDIKPKKVGIDCLEEWDYVTKQLLMMSASPLSKAINNLGPGAIDYFQDKISPTTWRKTPFQMEKDEFINIAELFRLWPFKPDLYEEQMIPSEE